MKRELPGGESRRAVLFAWWKVLFVKMQAKAVGVTWIRVKILDFFLDQVHWREFFKKTEASAVGFICFSRIFPDTGAFREEIGKSICQMQIRVKFSRLFPFVA